ncbi:MAG: succinate dehydrogenase, hydrophobic membrane anchor protein [Alphaproteobacteria bacterium]|nr:succinate dehydrogenase, hydrophobic membrane anchor protein [Alphaproteobacteria bacterium]
MSSLQTPLHKVQGLGASHSGTGHFWHERVTSLALVPLTLWFFFVAVGLAGASEAAAVGFLSHPLNAILMAAFVFTTLYHVKLGLQVVIDDYVHAAGSRILLLLLVLLAVLATGAFALFALIRIAGQS